ncbi:hypothetical protein ACHAQH_004907 [Verticillium albo-atrum]
MVDAKQGPSLRTVPETDEVQTTLLSSNVFRREGYTRMPSEGAIDISSFERRLSPSPDQGLGISTFGTTPRKPFSRVPVGSKTSSPASPRSFHGLMGSPDQMQQGEMGEREMRTPDMDDSPVFESPVATPKRSKTPAGLRKWLHGSWYKPAPPSYDMADQQSPSIGRPTPQRDETTAYQLGDREGPEEPLRRPSPENEEEDEENDKPFHERYCQVPHYCSSTKDVHKRRVSWLSISILTLSVYSTALSCLWFIIAIVQPRWGRAISTNGGIAPATASVVCTLFAKTIEMSFVTVFISFLGQVLSRRAFVKKSKGMTLAEMTMRNWVIQPGSLITHWETIPYAGITFLGVVSLVATVAATFYTTASEAMITPKIKFGGWEHKVLQGHVRSQYANPLYVNTVCATPLREGDPAEAGGSCLNVQYSGQSYRNLLSFMRTWEEINANGTSIEDELRSRPVGTTLLYDNTTMTAAWIESEFGDPEANSKKHDRIINNVTLAMPHPGVYEAATNPVNGILQPDDLSDVGEYTIRASVVSPSVNVLCVNMEEAELAPLVYTAWPNAETRRTGVGDQLIGDENWHADVPGMAKEEWLNRTVVDDIFRWGPEYKRRPPVFRLYPANFNMVANATHTAPAWDWGQPARDALYILAKSSALESYTLCELRSWVSPWCSTHFSISGIAGAHMKAHCEDKKDPDSYVKSYPNITWSLANMDWANVADQWQLSMDLNGGTYNNNASNARILTQLVLNQPKLNTLMPSIAEALAVLSSSTLTIASLSTPFVHYWEHPKSILAQPGALQPFNASLRTQEYTSSHTFAWHNVFYLVLFLVFAINVFCLGYLLARSGLVTDYTEPQNLFALAVNSPPSSQLGGDCGGGPGSRALVVPWRVGYARSENHYFFEEASERPFKGKWSRQDAKTSGIYEGETEGEGPGLISSPLHTFNMPAVNTLVARDALNQLAKRNWPQQEPGLMAVFVIVGLVAICLIGIYFFKWNSKRKARAQTQQI